MNQYKINIRIFVSFAIISKNMLKFGFHAIYSQLFENRSSRGEFMDWCRLGLK